MDDNQKKCYSDIREKDVMFAMGNKIYVVGHKNPDTDSICSAIAYANLKEKVTGVHYEPRRAGDVSGETAYVLDKFGLKVSQLYIAQVKKKCGLEVGKNSYLPKSEGARGPVDLCSARTGVAAETARQPQVTPEKEEAIMKAFRHFGVI